MGLVYSGMDLFEDYGIRVDSSGTWVKPERDHEFIHVPGRNGDLILDRGSWFNVEIVYRCHIDVGFASRYEDFVRWLSSTQGYEMLFDEKHPDVYRLAAPMIETLEPELTFTTETADFELHFNCKPQQYINDGVEHKIDLDFTEHDISADIEETRGAYWYGTPLVTVFAPGGARFEIDNEDGTWLFEISPFEADRIVIDFETGNAVLQDEMGDYVGPGNAYFNVTPPSQYASDFPESRGFITAYHGDDRNPDPLQDDPDPGMDDDMNDIPDDMMDDDMNGDDDMDDGEGSSETYTGYLEFDPRWYRI